MTTDNAPAIAIVRSVRDWAAVLHRYIIDHGGAVVKARPIGERQAIDEQYDVLVVDDISSMLTHYIVDELHMRDRYILGVHDPEEFVQNEERTGRNRLLRLGVDAIIEAQAPPEEFIRVITDLAPKRPPRLIDLTTPLHDPVANKADKPVEKVDYEALAKSFEPGGENEIVVPQSASFSHRRGHITAVLGATGGCGVTEVAAELARWLAKRGERTVLLDGDELEPSLAQRLNLPIHPNLHTAIDVIERKAGRLSECLTQIAKNLEVLVGIPHPRDWIDIRETEISALLNKLARGRPQIVINASPYLEDLTAVGMEMGTGMGSVDRFAISRTAVKTADAVVLVCPPTPVGVARSIDKIAELNELTTKPIHVVVNKSRRGSFKRKEIVREIERAFSPASIHFVPIDSRVENAAWDGTLVPSGGFTKAISKIEEHIPRSNFPSKPNDTSVKVFDIEDPRTQHTRV